MARQGDEVVLPSPFGACHLFSDVRDHPHFALWPLVTRKGERLALKVFRTRPFASVIRAARLQRAARGGCTLPVRMAWRHDESLVVVEPFADGPTLAETMDEERQARRLPSLAVVLKRFAQLAVATRDAHAADILHRDIKPDNAMFLATHGRATSLVLMDFHLACTASKSPTDGAGTTAYLAPEVARGGHHTRASDVFSLGATLVEMVVGLTPYEGDSEAETMRALCGARPFLSEKDLENVALSRHCRATHASLFAKWSTWLCHPRASLRPSAAQVLEQTRVWQKRLY